MKLSLSLYRLALALYPRRFREQFGLEMEEVFFQAAGAENTRLGLLKLFFREAILLPASLLDSYLWSMRSAGEGKLALAASGGGQVEGSDQRPDWAASLLAGLPHLLLGLVGGVPYLLSAANKNLRFTGALANYLPVIVLVLGTLAALIYGVTKGWGRWLASWNVYMVGLPTILVSLVVQTLGSTFDSNLADNVMALLYALLLPVLIAFLLYGLACSDRSQGMLASLPAMTVLWIIFHEFVPDLWRGLAWIWTFGIAFTAAILFLRSRRFNSMLAITLAVPILAGLPNVYLGVYLGGTLPYSEPGPSLRVVLNQYLPFLAFVSSLALGPLLALQVRKLGLSSAAEGGKRWHRIALAGVLSSLILVLVRYAIQFAGDGGSLPILKLQGQLFTGFNSLFIITELVFLGGIVLLLRAAAASGTIWAQPNAALKLALLALCLAGLPLILLYNLPGQYSIPAELDRLFILPILALVWLAASVWVVKD